MSRLIESRQLERKDEPSAPSAAEVKKLIGDLGTTIEEFKSEHKREVAELKKGLANPDREAKLTRLSEAIDGFEGKKTEIEKFVKSTLDRINEEVKAREDLERKYNKLALKGVGDVSEGRALSLVRFNQEIKSIAKSAQRSEPTEATFESMDAYTGAFAKLMRKGEKLLTPEEMKALQVGVDTDGGVMVPTDSSGRLVSKVFELSPIRQIAAVQNISGDRLEGIEVLGEAGSGWVGETTTRTETTTPTLGKYEIVAQEQYAAPRATQKLLDDGSIDVEGWLNGQVVGKFARLEGAAFVVGDGVSKPRGFTSYPTAVTGDATRAWGTLEIIKTGVSSDFAAADKADILFDIIGAFKPAYTVRANWVTNRAVMAKIRKMKQASTNDYLWQPGLTLGQPSQLLAYPITMAQDMPALAAGSLSLAFGDFTQGYQIVDRLGIRTLRDPYTAKPYVIFYTIKRVGGAVVNFEAIKLIYFGT